MVTDYTVDQCMHFYCSRWRTIMPHFSSKYDNSDNIQRPIWHTNSIKIQVQRYCAQSVINISLCMTQYAIILWIHTQITNQTGLGNNSNILVPNSFQWNNECAAIFQKIKPLKLNNTKSTNLPITPFSHVHVQNWT